MFAILANTACSNDADDDNIGQSNKTRGTVTFAPATDGVSVFIFGNENGDYLFQKTISSGWVNGILTTELNLGNYKFLFAKKEGNRTSYYPSAFDENTEIDDIEIRAATNNPDNGYVLPVDEIWLRDSYEKANKTYTIIEPTIVKDSLKRAVSQVVVNLKRGYLKDGQRMPLPFQQGINIMKDIENLTIDIDGVGKVINMWGESSGKAKTTFTASTASIDEDGFASVNGPFVFPAENVTEEAKVNVTINPKSGSAMPVLVKNNIQGPLLKNQQLIITIWMTSTYQLMNISVDVGEFKDEYVDDNGIWE